MISDKLQELEFKGIYIIDTRSFRIAKWTNFPERLYILDSDPLTRLELLQVLSIIKDKGVQKGTDIAEGFCPLKYLYVIWAGEDRYYILSRYFMRIRWKEKLTV